MSPSEVFICMSAFVKQFRSLVQNVFACTQVPSFPQKSIMVQTQHRLPRNNGKL